MPIQCFHSSLRQMQHLYWLILGMHTWILLAKTLNLRFSWLHWSLQENGRNLAYIIELYRSKKAACCLGSINQMWWTSHVQMINALLLLWQCWLFAQGLWGALKWKQNCLSEFQWLCIPNGLFFLFLLIDERSSTTHISRPLANDLGGSLAPLIGERKTSVPAHSSQPMLFTFDIPVRHSHSSLSNSVPQDYLFLHQCMSRKSESAR